MDLGSQYTEYFQKTKVNSYWWGYSILLCSGHIIIIIIKKGWQCKAGRERLTTYQSEDPNPTTPTHRMKEDKGKQQETKSPAILRGSAMRRCTDVRSQHRV